MLHRLLRPLGRSWLWLGALCLGMASQAQAPLRLPALGDGAEWSLGEERTLGDSIMTQVWRDPDVIDDPVLMQYVQSLWAPILKAARARGELSGELDQRLAWEMVLVRDRSVNAFALPGGYMGVHLGLIAVASNRDELAAVLAHETSHITQRHIARMLAQQNRNAPLMMGALLLGVLVAGRSPDAASALMIGGQAATLQNQLSFSRDMEREADRVGFGLMAPAGFHSHGAITLFDKLIQASRLNDSGAYPYLRSHPMSTERMADMAGRAQQLNPTDKPSDPDALHALMAARAKALTETQVDAQRRLMMNAKEQLAQGGTQPPSWAAWYAGVLAHARAREFDAAETLLSALRRSTQDQPALKDVVLGLAAELRLQQGQPDAALQELAQVSAASAQARPQVMRRAQAQLATGRPELIRQTAWAMDVWLGKHPRDAMAWGLSAQAQMAMGERLRGLRAEAESRAVQFDLTAAIDRLQAAQELAREMARTSGLSRAQEYDSAIIDTRLRQLRQSRREQTLQR
jgi:predicted Zn-dependent protease